MTKTSSLETAPPRDSVWTKYSPNHEFPVASTTSLVLHGLIVAAVILSGLALNARWHGDATRPPNLDVSYVAAGPGDGLPPGGGSPPGIPGQPIENVDSKETTKSVLDATPNAVALNPISPVQLEVRVDLPTIGDTQKSADLNKAFDSIEKNLKSAEGSKQRVVVPIGAGQGGGQGGGGDGPGKGQGVGPGTGIGGVPGTRAEILAKRWQFLISGESKTHLERLIAAGVTVGFVDGNNLFWIMPDLKRRPIKLQLESLQKYKEYVQWTNREPRSIVGLARELGLPAPPTAFVMFLPHDREQKFADAELRYAQEKNRDVRAIQKTWFDFRIDQGAFEPYVIGQEPFDPPPKW